VVWVSVAKTVPLGKAPDKTEINVTSNDEALVTPARKGDASPFILFEKCAETLRQISADMSANYKETCCGGLTVSSIER
jgi:L-serine deaminase